MGALCGLGWRICQQLFQRMVWKLLEQRRLLACQLFQQRLLSGKQLVQRLVLIPSQAFGRLEKAIIVDVARRSALEGIVSSLSQPR